MNDSKTKTWTVQEEEAGQRLDIFLAHQLSIPRAAATRLAAECLVNGSIKKASHTLRINDVVQCTEVEEAAEIVEPQSEPAPVVQHAFPPVLFEDEHLIIVNKPRGLSVHAGAGEKQVTLVDLLREHGTPLSALGDAERAGIVHRLDKDTSGVMVICKTDEAHQILAQAFANREIKKIYWALVCGMPSQQGRIEAPIFRHPVKRKKMVVQATGRPAVTEYKVLSSWPQFALVEVDLKTGRTHQIRVHFTYIHHPVVGDVVYGGYKRAVAAARSDELKNALQKMDVQALHAAKIWLEHPITKEPLHIETPMPSDMQNLIELLNTHEI